MSGPGGHSFWPRWRDNRLFTALVAVLVVYACVWILTAVRLNVHAYDAIGKAPETPRTIAVGGTGKVTAPPTVAVVSAGVQTDGGTDIASTQRQNTDRMNALIAAVKALGVADADIQTANYSIYPRYDYTNGKTTLVGYTVTQSVNVKVRDMTKVSAVFGKAGELGANQVSGPQFTIDDPESVRAEARSKAIEDAKAKAATLAASLGVRLVRVASFSESSSPSPVIYDYAKSAAPMGIGGGPSPDIQSGSLDVTSDVTVTYEIE